MAIIPEEALRLLKAKEFDVEFFKNLKTSKSHQEAYEKTEELYRSFFRTNKYSSFDSYRKGRDRRLKA